MTDAGQTRFRILIALSGIEIVEPLGRGDQLATGLFLTNDKSVIKPLLTPSFADAVGGLEFFHLLNADTAIYLDGSTDVALDSRTSLRMLDLVLKMAGMFLDALWFVRDNAVNFELGFVDVLPPNAPSETHSNFLARVVRFADGRGERVKFTRAELREARELFRDVIFPAMANTEHGAEESSPLIEAPKIAARSGVPRITRALYFLMLARSLSDPGLRIALYCSLLESLFSTDSAEITHKISHRIAIFLGTTVEERRAVFGMVKKAYTVRSKVIHGDVLGKDSVRDIHSTAVETDDFVRRILRKIVRSEALSEVFAAKKERLDEFFLHESFRLEVRP